MGENQNMERKLSLQKLIAEIILVAYSLVLLMLVFLEVYMFANYRNTIREKWQNALYESVQKVEGTIDSVNANMYELYSYDTNFKALETARGIDCLAYGYQLSDQLKTLELYEKRNISYMLYYDDMAYRKYYFNQGLYSNADIEAIKETMDVLVDASIGLKSWSFREINGKPYAVSVYRSGRVALCEICNLEQVKQQLGKKLKQDGAEVYVAYNGTLLETDEAAQAYAGMDLEKDAYYNRHYILTDEIGNTGLSMVLCIPVGIWTILNVQQILLILVMIVSAFCICWLYRRLKKGLIEPLKQMTAEMERISDGEMDTRIVSTSRFEEMQRTIDTVNVMVDEIQKQKMTLYEQTIENQKTQMQYLTMQLKPHFYLNGLKTLNALAMNGENEKMQDVIIKLSSYLRNLLQIEREEITLESEINCVKNYVEFQQAALERPITIEWQVEVEKCWYVPNLCLQTFVENSVKYAKTMSSARGLTIWIQIHELETEDGTFLDIYIRDNGTGFPEDVLEIINGPVISGSACVGINNLKRRCTILYGDKFEYGFTSDPGAVVSYIIPYHKREEQVK